VARMIFDIVQVQKRNGKDLRRGEPRAPEVSTKAGANEKSWFFRAARLN